MSQKIAELESYFMIRDELTRRVFSQAYENMRALQTQIDELKSLIANANDLAALQNTLKEEE